MKSMVVGIAVALAAPGIAHAHDFWIEPATFRPEPGAELKIGLRVGEQFEGTPVHRDPKKLKSFTITSPSSEGPVPGVEGSEPAGVVKIETRGIHVIGYRTNHSNIELNANDFEGYLKEEGLEHIIAERAKRGESETSAKEIYSRCAKAILAAGSSEGGGHDRLLGFPLELVPEKNPYDPMADRKLTFRLLFHGQPLAGAKVTARNREDGKNSISGTTNADGKVTFPLDKPGVWLVTSVHMFPAPAKAKADWESLWASLTFEFTRP